MIVTLAVNSPYYGQMAFNLATSIKRYADIPVAVIADTISLSRIPEHDKWVFDEIIPIEAGANPFEVKTRINQLTPFKQTVFIDADVVAINDPTQSLEKISKESLWFDVVGVNDTYWANNELLQKEYGLKEIVNVNTSIFGFKSLKKTDKFFSKVNELYHNPVSKYKHIGGYYPDEIPFNIEYSKVKRNELKSSVLHHSDEKFHIRKTKGYSFISMNGKMSPYDPMVKYYDMVVRSNALQFGLPVFKFKTNAKVFK